MEKQNKERRNEPKGDTRTGNFEILFEYIFSH